MKTSITWLLCFLTGLTLMVLSAVIFPLFPQDMAMPNGIDSPVIAFEFARNYADLVAVFGPIDDPLRTERILAMDQGNRLDMVYMVIYSAFIALFFWAAFLRNRRVIWLAFMAIGLLAGVADAIENSILFGITEDLEIAHHLNWLPYPVHAKFLSLYLCAFGVGLFLKNSIKGLLRMFGISLLLLSPIAIILMFAGHATTATLVITLAWLAQLFIAYSEYSREKRMAA